MNNGARVRTTFGLFLNGAFVRSESGRTMLVRNDCIAQASRKDVRDAVVAAGTAQPAWAALAPLRRGRMLYRIAELVESRAPALVAGLIAGGTADAAGAQTEVDAAIARIVWYAGWADKYGAMLSAREAVSGPYITVTSAEPIGIVATTAPNDPPLLGLITVMLPALVAGNAVIAIASERDPQTAIALAECLAASDLPRGIIAILTGIHRELVDACTTHNGIDALHLAHDTGDVRAALAEAPRPPTLTLEPEAPREWWFEDSRNTLERIREHTKPKTATQTAGI